MTEQRNITAIILAGGKSTRMKTDKGLLYFKGKRLVEYVIAAARGITDKIILVTANPEYQQFGYTCIADEYKEKGPLGGIYTGLLHSGTAKNLFLGCDMPNLSIKLLGELQQQSGTEEVLLTEHKGMAEPLCSVYDRSCLAHLRSLLEQNQLKITDALAGLKTRVISFDGADWFHGNELANINSIEELGKYNN